MTPTATPTPASAPSAITTAGEGLRRALLADLDGWKLVIARALLEDLAPRCALEMIFVVQIIRATLLLEDLAQTEDEARRGDPGRIRAQAAASRTIQANLTSLHRHRADILRAEALARKARPKDQGPERPTAATVPPASIEPAMIPKAPPVEAARPAPAATKSAPSDRGARPGGEIDEILAMISEGMPLAEARLLSPRVPELTAKGMRSRMAAGAAIR